jgi:hypothetical protein
MLEAGEKAKTRAESNSWRFYGHPWHVVSKIHLIDSTVVRSNERFGMLFLAVAEDVRSTVPIPRRQSAGLPQPAASARNGRSAFTSDSEQRLNAA